MLKKSLMIILIITLLFAAGIAAYVYLKNSGSEHKEESADEIVAKLITPNPITTNLTDAHYLKIKYTVEADTAKHKEELSKLTIKFDSIAVKELSSFSAKDLKGKEGITLIEKKLTEEFGKNFGDGKIKKVMINDFLIQ